MKETQIRVRVVIPLLGILILCFCTPMSLTTMDSDLSYSRLPSPRPFDNNIISSAGNVGDEVSSVMQYSREIQGLNFALMNSFGDTASHLENVDFSAYHIPGWSLYEVQISASRVVAQSECEVVGKSSSPSNVGFRIFEHDMDLYYDQLAQGFYNMSHYGKLENLSILYDSPTYDPLNQMYAYLDIRSDYQNGSTNMVSSVQLNNVGLTATWASVIESVILSADTTYYAVMNGSNLIEYSSIYPLIRWFYEDITGAYLTRRHNTDGDTWGSDRPFEALLNYTYIPWNTTSDSALEFTNPESVALQGNASTLSGSDWLFSSTSNVSVVQFSSNQSISIEYDLTLRYKQNILSQSAWFVGSSGTDVVWNITSVLDFPELSGSQDKNLTLILPTDWTANHLFNLTYPTQYYDHFSQEESTVVCALLNDETWVLECTSPNYLQSISKYDSNDDSTINDIVSVSVIMDINSTIESPSSIIATNGQASLRVFYQNSVEYSENFSVAAGKSYHQWDISSHSSSNGLYTIDVSWMNGTEAGYLNSDVLVYYQTNLVADDYFIDAFTDDSFYLGIDFNQVFPVGGIDSTSANVTYSFGTVVNQSLEDQSGGRWDTTVSTSGMSLGTYDLSIHAEGYALENRSLTIQVALTHDTEALTFAWSNKNDITYVETTELAVYYNRVTGSTPIPDAIVNVTIGVKTWNLTWDGSTAYRITFNGTDVPPGLGSHSLTIEAWKAGHVARSNASQTLNIQAETTTMTYEWSNGNSITYIGSTTLIVNYTMSDGSQISDASVNVTIGSLDPFYLTFNGSVYKYVFDGDAALPGIDVHNLTIFAGKHGYANKTISPVSLTIDEEPTTLVISWSDSNSISYVGETYLIANYTMSDGSPVLGALINFTIGADPPWVLPWDSLTKTYRFRFSGADSYPGFGEHNLTILADRFGFEEKSNVSQLIVHEETTNLNLIWLSSTPYEGQNNTITYEGQTILSAKYTMSNGTAIRNALINASIDGAVPVLMIWDGDSQTYRLIFSGKDDPPGLGNHSIVVLADLFGYQNRSYETFLKIVVDLTTIEISWSNETTITYAQQTTLSVTYRMNDTTPIEPDANVTALVGTTLFNLTWNPGNSAYEITFNGTDSPPGFGSYNVIIGASMYGYQSQSNDTYWLTINIEPTTLELSWLPSDTIPFVNQTVLYANYSMSDGSPVRGAYVNASIASREWIFVWNEPSEMYMLILYGYHADIGVGTFPVTVEATLYGFDPLNDTTETLTVYDESTELIPSWSYGNSPGYFNYTFLFADYRMSNLTTIRNATLSVTIDTTTWEMIWNETASMYQVRFNGSDTTPGIGTHSLLIQAWKYGYISRSNDTETLTLPVIPTTVLITWSNTNNITYVEQTTLIVTYSMFNGTTIQDAIINVTIGVKTWNLTWDGSTAYRITFNGTDVPPGFGSHSLTIEAWRTDFEQHTNLVDSFTITEEPTSLIITWSNGYNITFVKETTLSVRYQMSNATSIPGAVLNATINGQSWTLTWNPVSEAYETIIRGSDDPPGYGTYTVELHASKFGFVSIVDTTQEFTIRFEDTSISFVWSPSSTITYIEHTKLRISYLMSNGTPIVGATVNITRGPSTWIAIWNSTFQAYEYSWAGTDDPPGLGSHLLLIKAWKVNYIGISDTSQTLRIEEEPTSIQAIWTNGNLITYVQSTTLQVNYTTSDGTTILGALVDVTIGTDNWILSWNAGSQLYEITFIGSDNPPGLGTHGLSIRGWQFGYKTTVNTSMTLTITGEMGSISSELIGGNTISYVGYTILTVNYTMSNGTAIPLATVNVTISGTLWNLTWHASSGTYRIQFNGTDSPPGLGTHNLIVKAWRNGFDGQTDSTKYLTINEETTNLVIYWGAPNYNNLTYFEYTILYVEYKMSNGTVIQGANVNVTIDSDTWDLAWNSTQGAYSLRFNGSDSPPGLGMHSLIIEAEKYGFEHRVVSDITLILSKDPTFLGISWIGGNDITYVEHTILSVSYKMSNGSDITNAIVNATIGITTWSLTWNGTAGAYQTQFNGNQDPPGLGSFSVTIQASADVYVAQTDSSSLTIQNESTAATPSWSSFIFDWTDSAILSIDFKDSYGTLIDGATTKSIFVNGTEYELMGTNGTYWFEFNSTFDLGLHNVWANLSKFGYNTATAVSITFTIVEAPTALAVSWSSTSIDYLGQFDLAVDYYTTGLGTSVPSLGVLANITIDSSITIPLALQGGFWIANLTGISLDLGDHEIVIRAWAYGYEYSEISDMVTVDEVITNALVVSWNPVNLTIEYIDSFDLTVDYTYYGGDVPSSSIVNVTIDGRLYVLVYSAGLWSVSIPGDELGIGVYTATVSAWAYGYSMQSDVTANLNVTEAANSFLVTWEPWDLDASFIDLVNVSVIYTQDFIPIAGATVQLAINSTPYQLTYSDVDKKWHFSILATNIGLGNWNVTVTANKTGYANGWDSRILTISPATTNLTIIVSATSIYYDEDVTIDIYYQLLNSSIVPGAMLTLEVDGLIQIATWEVDHWTYTRSGSSLGLGLHTIHVNTAASGFNDATDTFDISVNAIPTSVSTLSPSITIYAYESVTISFTWIDEKNSVNLGGFAPQVTWLDTYSVIDHGNGTYSIEINSNMLHVGNYELQVDFVGVGYEDGSALVGIDIIELPIALVHLDQIEQFENETIVVNIQMFEALHASVVDWGEIIIELEGIQYSLSYDEDSEQYSVEIWLSTLLPGSYVLNFTASAIDCETEFGEIQLEIEEKIAYTLNLDVDEEALAGQAIQITVLATYESGVVYGLPLTVHVLIEREQGTTEDATEIITTNSEGIATRMFNVPLDATGLTIWAEFDGSIGEWPAISNIINREIIPSGMDILSFFMWLFGNPVFLVIIMSLIGVPAGGAFILRRRRGKIASSAVDISDAVISPSSAPTAPAGEMDSLRDIIKKHPEGISRANIAKSLEISTSKASALVRKLLGSDSGFEEIKDGNIRKIRFCGEE